MLAARPHLARSARRTPGPRSFHPGPTTAADRKEVVRHLVERVAVAVQGETEWVDVTIHWAGGFVSRHEVRRPVRRVEQLRDYPALLARVKLTNATAGSGL